MQIYINRDGQQFGPFTLDQVNQGLAAGQLLPNDFAFYDGLQQWTPLTQIQGVIIPGASPVAAPAPIQAEIAATPVSEEEESAVIAEPDVTAGVDGATKKKRIIMIAGIGVGVVAVICVLLFVYPGFLENPDIPEVKIVKPIIPLPDQSFEPAIQLPDVSDFRTVSYSRDIKLIFENKCVDCHGPKKKKGKLDLSNKEGVIAGADGQSIYVAGEPEESLLVELVLHPDDPMPPPDEGVEPLTEEEKKEIIAWIAQGAEFN